MLEDSENCLRSLCAPWTKYDAPDELCNEARFVTSLFQVVLLVRRVRFIDVSLSSTPLLSTLHQLKCNIQIEGNRQDLLIDTVDMTVQATVFRNKLC